MKTLRLAVDPNDLNSDSSQAAIHEAASILRQGGLVAFPTETVYGLGANALNAEAVEKIFHAKQRPSWDPLIVHVSDAAMLSSVVDQSTIGKCARSLMQGFWPGPLTLLLPKSEAVPLIVTADRPLVGVRIPAHPVARALIAAAGMPIAAPSANSFGRISPTLAAHVLEDLDGRVDAVLDSGETTHGLESTVVDASQEPVLVYRPGVISIQQIRAVCGSAIEWKAPATKSTEQSQTPESMPSPGVGIRHYAPRTRLLLVEGEGRKQAALFTSMLDQELRKGTQVGIMLPTNFIHKPLPIAERRVVVFPWGDWHDPAELAHRIFAGLRTLDAAGVSVILCPVPPAAGIGLAIRDRLFKAAMSR